MDEPGLPEVVSSEVAFAGRVITVVVDRLRDPDTGRLTSREVIEHAGAVVVLALDTDRRLALVRQYRHAVRRHLLELPAGTLEAGEDPLCTAQRELEEETGLRAAHWQSLGSFFSSPGFLHEELHAFFAGGLSPGRQDFDDDEQITVEWLALDELLARPQQLQDAKTLAGLLLLRAGWEAGQVAL